MKRLAHKIRPLSPESLLPKALVLAIALIGILPSAPQAARGEVNISGKVLDTSGEPIIGATVILRYGDSLVSGAAGDIDGAFAIRLTGSVFDGQAQLESGASWTLTGSSIGFASATVTLSQLTNTKVNSSATSKQISNIANDIVIVLTEEQVSVEGVTVVAETEKSPMFQSQAQLNVTEMASRGLSVTNPIEAVRAPEVSRSGSALGSQIRFSGSNPDYTLNGASIGRDPAHYGMFSVLPSVAISEVGFSDQALDAKQESPGQVELKTDRSFSERSSGELTLSALEAVGGYRKGTDKWFVNAALRKSVLDKIVNSIDNQSERRTIPPTNFQDIFISTGIKLSPATSLFLDQYHTQDFLAFNSEATTNNTAGIEALQHTRNRMFGAHLQHITPSALVNLKVTARFDKAIYRANSADIENPAALSLDLQDNTTTIRSDADIAFSLGANQITSGITVSRWSTPELSLSQRNWNFLPPYSTSDNPHYYQGLVNSQYSAMDITTGGTDLALFTQFERSAGFWRLRAGLRAQRYSYLQTNTDILARLAVARRLNSNVTAQFSFGSYAEAPLSSLLEPYQVLVRSNLSALRSVSTQIAKMSLTAKPSGKSRYDFSLFAKTIDNLPTLTPSFSADGSTPTSLDMRSNGSQHFLGLTAAYSRKAALADVFGERLDIRTGYAFTYTTARTNGVATNYSEDSPHRFEMDATYHASSAVKIGGLFTVRTGNRYTAPFTSFNQSAQLGQDYYESNIASENSSRFPAHINLNLSVSYRTGSWTTMANVGNAFNRANPIVSAYDGYVYDASVLPSIGVTYSF